MVLLFLTAPLAYLPTAALAAVLISSAFGLFDVESLRRYQRLSKPEFRDSVIAMLGTMTVGVLPGVLHRGRAGAAQAIEPVRRARAMPSWGWRRTRRACTARKRKPAARTIPGLLMYRFDAALLCFNADYFKDRVRTLIAQAAVKPTWVHLRRRVDQSAGRHGRGRAGRSCAPS